MMDATLYLQVLDPDSLRQSTMRLLHQGNSLKAELKSSILKIYLQVQVF